MAHHTVTLSSCNGTSWSNMGFSAIPVILRVQIYSEMKTSITTKQQIWGLFLQQRVQFAKLSFASQSGSPVSDQQLSHWWKHSSSAALYADDADTPIYRAGWASVFLWGVSNLASISSSSSSVSPCILHVLLLSRTVRMEPTTRNFFSSILNCCSFRRGASGNFCLNWWWRVL